MKVAGGKPGEARLGRPWRIARVAIAVLFGVLALGVVFDVSTTSPQLCSSCHEMLPRATTWAESAHNTVDCVKCHQTPTAWYEIPQRVVGRGALYARDVLAHLSGDYQDPVEVRSPGVDPVRDAVCLQCHDPNRTATSGYRILIDHAEHAKRNGSCVSCHVRTAHPVESRGTALTLMAQCYTCHGTSGQPEASAECDVCHPSDYELVPASHAAARWENGRHGDIAQADVALCGMCHEQRLCDDCHGVEMPHPDEWVEGAAGHGVAAEGSPDTCRRCHNEEPDMCTMCHHTKFDPMKGTWIKQHHLKVEDDGVAYCMECHGPTYCVDCHIGRVR